MENGKKTWALVVLAALAMLGLIANLGFAWYGNPMDWNIVNIIVSSFRDILILIIGFLTGSSIPESSKIRATEERKDGAV